MSNRRFLDPTEIKIGRRHRKDMGAIDELVASIDEIGLLHPIVVRPDGRLIAGERRLRAIFKLKWDRVPVHVVDLESIAKGEAAENFVRKDFTLTEAVAIQRELEPELKAAARERQGTRTDKHPGKLPESSKGQARDKVAAFTGRKARSLDKARKIVEAAEADPEKFGKLVEDMDRTGRVDGPYRRLNNIIVGDQIRSEPPPLPGNGPYRVIVIDPPWPFETDNEAPERRAYPPYPSMKIEDITALRVIDIAHEDCIVWLWAINRYMPQAFAILEAWGFEHKTILTWAKDKFGLGDWLRGQTEHCILAVRGSPTVTLTNQTTLLLAPVTRHSEKPDAFYELVERLCPAPRYAELFQRRQREGWDGHGNEAGNSREEFVMSTVAPLNGARSEV